MIEENLYQELVEIRHYLHAHPEISEKEVETTKFIRQKLADWQIEIMDSQLKTGLVAKIGSGKPIIALRADIDALPILEETGLEFSSVLLIITSGLPVSDTILIPSVFTVNAEAPKLYSPGATITVVRVDLACASVTETQLLLPGL